MANENLQQIKTELLQRGHTFASIAKELQLNKGTVSKVFSDTYTGTQATKDKIINHCVALLEDKPVNLLNDILRDSVLYAKLMNEGSLLNTFKAKERGKFIKMYEALEKYNKSKKKSNKNKAA